MITKSIGVQKFVLAYFILTTYILKLMFYLYVVFNNSVKRENGPQKMTLEKY